MVDGSGDFEKMLPKSWQTLKKNKHQGSLGEYQEHVREVLEKYTFVTHEQQYVTEWERWCLC